MAARKLCATLFHEYDVDREAPSAGMLSLLAKPEEQGVVERHFASSNAASAPEKET